MHGLGDAMGRAVIALLVFCLVLGVGIGACGVRLARAEGPDAGLAPLTAADAPFAVHRADGGPVDGECMTTRGAAEVIGNGRACRRQVADLEKALQEKPEGIDPGTALKAGGVAFLLGVLAGVYLAKKL